MQLRDAKLASGAAAQVTAGVEIFVAFSGSVPLGFYLPPQPP